MCLKADALFPLTEDHSDLSLKEHLPNKSIHLSPDGKESPESNRATFGGVRTLTPPIHLCVCVSV